MSCSIYVVTQLTSGILSYKLANVATSSIYLLREGAQEPLNLHYWIHGRWNHTLSKPCYTTMTVSVCKQDWYYNIPPWT